MKMTAIIAAVLAGTVSLGAQTKPASGAPSQGAGAKPSAPAASAAALSDYVIGPADVLSIAYRNEKDMTGDYIVRPDGKITLPYLGDIQAEGFTPEKLTEHLLKISDKLYKSPTITVGVKEIKSKTVSITGGVVKPGEYPIHRPMDVLNLISLAGGLREFTNGKEIRIIRGQGANQQAFLFNYKEVQEGRNLQQNIPLQSGDRVMVPE